MKALCWKKFDAKEVKIRNSSINISQESNSSESGTGLILWDSAIVLAKYLEKNDLVENKVVLELGAGVGYLSCVVNLLGAKHIIATDLKYTFSIMKQNFKNNKISAEKIEVLELDWFNPLGFKAKNMSLDYIIASDIIWKETLVNPLISTLKYLFDSYPKTKLLLANQSRSLLVESIFFEGLTSIKLSYTKINKILIDEEYRVSNIEIYRITRET